ncbi:MAG: molybdate ABC transporter substrate-binding protein [Candidatus Reconcilbacillus cellulovorans]|uniref:Molybdate ABC transporter substrate-binding protein n=1 Tax=Candidatus Reconcilbacillus cellulovorans TaxID=1906605 RepID=A0A2A6DX21_9BACL|nr:MAG: molybdate ABC transporter substrate-binding protein [Candidatus Reconcilbacillus cellulovorans]
MQHFTRLSALFAVVCAAVLAAGCKSQQQTSVLTISAAASLADALKDIQPAYESNHNVRILYNFGASGALRQQIEQGAPVDVFLSASSKEVDRLITARRAIPESLTEWLSNELVVVVSADARITADEPRDLLRSDFRKIAVGIPEIVPAGAYAKQALTALDLWDDLQPKIVRAKDVQEVLHHVETHNADAGFVYRTDAATSSGVRIAFAVDSGLHDPIRYAAVIVSTTRNRKEAEAFLTYLTSENVIRVFAEYGFRPVR